MRTKDLRHFRRLARSFGRVLGAFDGGAICCVGLTVPQAHALLEIEDRRQTNVVELAKALGVSKGTVSKTVDTLVESGLVERAPRESDRRYNDLMLTQAGSTTAEKVHELGDDVAGRTFEMIAAESHHTVLECFEILVEASRAADRERSHSACECTENFPENDNE